MLSKVLILFALGLGADAFAPTAWTTTSRASSVMKAAQMTKFERMTKNYKGMVNMDEEEVDTEEVGFTYDEFQNILSEKSVSFLRGDVVKGTVVQFQAGGSKTQGALIDIGAKVEEHTSQPESESSWFSFSTTTLTPAAVWSSLSCCSPDRPAPPLTSPRPSCPFARLH